MSNVIHLKFPVKRTKSVIKIGTSNFYNVIETGDGGTGVKDAIVEIATAGNPKSTFLLESLSYDWTNINAIEIVLAGADITFESARQKRTTILMPSLIVNEGTLHVNRCILKVEAAEVVTVSNSGLLDLSSTDIVLDPDTTIEVTALGQLATDGICRITTSDGSGNPKVMFNTGAVDVPHIALLVRSGILIAADREDIKFTAAKTYPVSTNDITYQHSTSGAVVFDASAAAIMCPSLEINAGANQAPAGSFTLRIQELISEPVAQVSTRSLTNRRSSAINIVSGNGNTTIDDGEFILDLSGYITKHTIHAPYERITQDVDVGSPATFFAVNNVYNKAGVLTQVSPSEVPSTKMFTTHITHTSRNYYQKTPALIFELGEVEAAVSPYREPLPLVPA